MSDAASAVRSVTRENETMLLDPRSIAYTRKTILLRRGNPYKRKSPPQRYDLKFSLLCPESHFGSTSTTSIGLPAGGLSVRDSLAGIHAKAPGP